MSRRIEEKTRYFHHRKRHTCQRYHAPFDQRPLAVEANERADQTSNKASQENSKAGRIWQ